MAERDLPVERARYYTHRRDFPRPVVKLSGTRAWLKHDVVAYFAGEPFPEREEFELQEEFLSFRELAAMMGKEYPKQLSQTTRIPEPVGLVSNKRYWRKSEAERWLKEDGRPTGRKAAQRAELPQ